MDLIGIIAITLGVLVSYVLGYLEGRDRGYEAGRKDGSKRAFKIFMAGLTGNAKLLEDDDG